MGYHRHHAIVVTAWADRYIEPAHRAALDIFSDTPAKVTPITPAGVNGYRSFLVAPDGSKEGWDDSDLGDAARKAFIEWLQKAAQGDIYTSWAEVEFGGDDADMVGVTVPNGRLWGSVDDA